MASATKIRQTSGKELPRIGEVAERAGLSPRSGGSRLPSEGGD